MNTKPLTAAGLSLVAAASATAAIAFAGAGHRSEGAGAAAVTSVSGTPAVVVELFTSEGCSSCPPADVVLADLTRTQPVSGAHVIGLEEHVTYWDGRAWRDPFSAAAFTTRQNDYAQAFHNSQVYTPQMVVNGQTEFVGSDGDRARAEVRRSAQTPQARVSLTATPAVDGSIGIDVRIANLPKGVSDAEVFIALTQDGLSSHVRGGENSGRSLPHNSVARSFTRLGTAGNADGGGTLHTSIRLPSGASLSKCHVLAFVQKPDLGRILGAADVSLAGLGG